MMLQELYVILTNTELTDEELSQITGISKTACTRIRQGYNRSDCFISEALTVLMMSDQALGEYIVKWKDHTMSRSSADCLRQAFKKGTLQLSEKDMEHYKIIGINEQLESLTLEGLIEVDQWSGELQRRFHEAECALNPGCVNL